MQLLFKVFIKWLLALKRLQLLSITFRSKDTIDDLSSVVLPPGFGIPCKQHPKEEYRFFCTECDAPICRDCKILKHEGHPTRSLEDVHEERKQYLTDAIRLANKNVRKLHSECAEINSKRVDIEQETRDLEQEILNHVNQLKKIIDDIAERMMKIVKAQNNESQGSLYKSRDSAKGISCASITFIICFPMKYKDFSTR